MFNKSLNKMKKSTALLLLFLAIITLTAYSQLNSSSKTVSPSENIKYFYCELVQQDRYFQDKFNTNTFLNFGTKSSYQKQYEESSYIKLQKDGMDALNYMCENDWELVTKNVREFSSSGIETCYLLRKKVL
jgi:hypothetical protein